MTSKIQQWLKSRFPQNFILKKPFWGTLILSGFTFSFSVLYRPFHFHESRTFSYGVTFALYNLILFLPVFGCLRLLRKVPYFSKENDWTLIKEILAILIMLFCTGVILYFAGFIMEDPSARWNLSTFWGSVKYGSLIVIIPFVFFTVSNYRYLFFRDILQFYNQADNQSSITGPENAVQIISQLKKEELSFMPSQFLFAESDGNYVDFHLVLNGQHVKKTIRNSINDIEQQLSTISFVMRIHRAFLVNLRKVQSKKGNSLGYRLKLSDSDVEIPVSRNNTKNFDKQMKQFR
jgi:hypothetical protein